MSTFLLIRHAVTDVAGVVLTGRDPGIHLNEHGQREAAELAAYLADLPIQAIYCSPLERARETALPISHALGLPIRICENLNELNFGAWTGSSIERLDEAPQWQRFNTLRSVTAAPAGEWMLEVQTRMVKLLEGLRSQHSMTALVSHGDVIRAALCYFLGTPVDLYARIQIDPASISTVSLEEDGIQVLAVNQRVCMRREPIRKNN